MIRYGNCLYTHLSDVLEAASWKGLNARIEEISIPDVVGITKADYPRRDRTRFACNIGASYYCSLCGQYIPDGRPCGCGARH